MSDEAFLRRQRTRIEARVAWARTIIDNNRIDATFKAKEILPAQIAALARMKRGVYGICLGCENEISRPRLETVPAALRCVECQTSYEKNSRHD